mmetsp:Transcript_11820/g.30184  ORF Transcript_11820/g.30184 Transcript_11820/m.30184 type:complete len:217 (+) Transcript_11820:660-1310(+)
MPASLMCSQSGTMTAPRCFLSWPTIIICEMSGEARHAFSSGFGSTFSPFRRTIVSFSRPTCTSMPPILCARGIAGILYPRSPVSNHPSPKRNAFAVSSSLPQYPAKTLGPRASIRPVFPSSTSSPVSGSTTLTWLPGTGKPMVPLAFTPPSAMSLVDLAASTGAVSVRPQPLMISKPTVSKKSSRYWASEPPPLTTTRWMLIFDRMPLKTNFFASL